MAKYRILLVDDEDIIRQGLRSRLEYFNFPDLDICEAASGAEALAQFKRFGSNIALAVVDICMPDMSGLELIAQARNISARTRFVLLSGFAEFGYAREGIRLGVRAYLNKPVPSEVLRAQVEGILRELKQEEQSQGDVGERERLSREREFNLLLSGANRGVPPRQAFPGLYARWPELFDGSASMYLSILHIGARVAQGPMLTMDGLDELRWDMRNLFMDMQGAEQLIIMNSHANMQRLWVVHLGAPGAPIKGEVERMFLRARQELERRDGISITMGVSALADALSCECAMQARAALRQRKLHGRSNIYFFEDISAYEAQSFPEAELELLRRAMARGDRAGVRECLNRLLAEERLGARNVEYLNVLWVRVISLMLSTFDKMDIALTNHLLSQLTRADAVADQRELVNALTELIGSCFKADSPSDGSMSDRISYALKYMSARFSEDIVLNDLAARLDMSPAYFSSVFKREVGMSPMQYITELRMKKACEYLATTDESVASIAQKTGYDGGQYFFRVFRKMTGMTPLMYRQQARSGQQE